MWGWSRPLLPHRPRASSTLQAAPWPVLGHWPQPGCQARAIVRTARSLRDRSSTCNKQPTDNATARPVRGGTPSGQPGVCRQAGAAAHGVCTAQQRQKPQLRRNVLFVCLIRLAKSLRDGSGTCDEQPADSATARPVRGGMPSQCRNSAAWCTASTAWGRSGRRRSPSPLLSYEAIAPQEMPTACRAEEQLSCRPLSQPTALGSAQGPARHGRHISF